MNPPPPSSYRLQHPSSASPRPRSEAHRILTPLLRLALTLLLLALGHLASSRSAVAADPLLVSNHSNYFPGEDIVVTFANGPGNPKDWIGVYPDGVVPGSVVSTIWRYVNGTETSTIGFREGTILFPTGLNLGGPWAAYFLVNDGYTSIATNLFNVVDPGTTLVRTDRRIYGIGQPIAITFTNGPANPKDWIAIYRESQTPGAVNSTLWAYVGGTQTATDGRTDGVIQFANGLTNTGRYVAYLLLDDGYDVLASETFEVAAAAGSAPRLISVAPADNATGQPPRMTFAAVIAQGATQINTSGIVLKLDDTVVTPSINASGDQVTIDYTSPLVPSPASVHRWSLTAPDNASPPNVLQVDVAFTIADYRNIVLPAPLYFENFDTLAEGSLPNGWTQTSYTTPINETIDFGDLGSAAYAGWVVVNADRFTGSFVTYGNPDNPDSWESDYQRVLRPNPLNVLNGQILDGPLATGRFLFGNSGYQNGSASQVLYLFTQDYNLSGRTNVHLAFKSLWEQNQDSIAAVEYSTDRGTTWKPIAYFLDGPDIVTLTDDATGQVTIDAEATFYAEHSDVARYTDELGNEIGGTYGAFIGAPISPDLAPFIQRRFDDNPTESKRVELFPLPDADNQPAVRFRFAHAGTDSWYFGIDDFGLYSVTAGTGEPPTLAITRSGTGLQITWTGTLESADTVVGPWTPVTGATSPATVAASEVRRFYRARN